MAGPGLSESSDCRPKGGGIGEAAAADYQETIEILQEEIARLERELQLRDESREDAASHVDSSFDDKPETSDAADTHGGDPLEVERLQKELDGRDETIVLLLDELSRVDEAQKASRAEWEQLNGWVAELEDRVAGQDGSAAQQLQNELAAQRQKADALQLKSEQERRAWEAQRQVYQEEVTRLQASLDEVSVSNTAPADVDSGTLSQGVDPGVVEALQAENLRLRAAWQELVERASAAEHSEALEAKLAETLNERQQLRRKLEQVDDERKRERLEHEATVAELRSRQSELSQSPSQDVVSETKPAGAASERDLDMRVRALRQHLQEIEERERMEREERRQKNLVVRLSRLWSRTSPR
jgi:myosin heavy subunit